VPVIECPFCKAETTYDEEHASYVCSSCGGEVFPPDDDDSIAAEELWQDEQRYKKSISKRGGGTRQKGRKKQANKNKINAPWLYDT